MTSVAVSNTSRILSVREQVFKPLSAWVSSLLQDSLVLAAPKKKTSHQKKRSRLLGPGDKQLKTLGNLNRCPSCGHYKRANTLCQFCVNSVFDIWKGLFKSPDTKVSEEALTETDKRIIYPGRKLTPRLRKLNEPQTYLNRRWRTLRKD